MGHLKTLGTQMGYPIGVLIWVVVEINDQKVHRSERKRPFEYIFNELIENVE